VADIAATYFIGGGDGDRAAGASLGAERALFLHDYNDAVACMVGRVISLVLDVSGGVVTEEDAYQSWLRVSSSTPEHIRRRRRRSCRYS